MTKRNSTFLVVLTVLSCLMMGMASAQEYKIGAGDVVKVLVYEHEDLTTAGQVTQSGGLVMPLIGQVKIEGLTAAEAEKRIAAALKSGGYVKFPQVTVAVEEFRSQQVAIMGEVAKPNKYAMTPGTTSLIDLLAMAGGVTNNAANYAVVISERGGRKSSKRVDLTTFYSGDLSQNISVGAGDIILVPQMDKYYIYGEVKNPGSYRLEKNMTVVQALSVGGGLTQRGTQKGIRVKRQGKDGKVVELKVDLEDTLQPNDVVYVKESFL